MKKVIIAILVMFVLFGTMYSHNAQSGMSTDMYVQELYQQIAYYQAKVDNRTATAYDIQMLRQLRERLSKLGR